MIDVQKITIKSRTYKKFQCALRKSIYDKERERERGKEREREREKERVRWRERKDMEKRVKERMKKTKRYKYNVVLGLIAFKRRWVMANLQLE